ncbi:hypothetical protein D5F01_LYC24059 [Larimichthys crocea]|uniref:Uncharacterized protein n=1 Tax=Larimichthys crocea TaxID=215358 RepID=A0A6G0HFU1_LARCR|nr:hypothetical protein D5F01_LYC24059 [Larimichthys crocea]
MKLQAATLTDYVHVLFYSRWNMKNEREMLYQVKHRNLIAVCLEDLPDLFPKEMYKYVIREYNAMYFMDYLRQLVMYKATRFREVVRTKCDKERAAVLTGNALMYVDMDIDFHNPPKEWLAPEGVLSFIVVQNTEFRIKVKALNGDLDALSRRAITEASQWMKGENCMVMVCYGKENTFRKMVPVPERSFVVKTWVLGTRAYGLFANIGALAYGDPVTKTFVALDLSQTVNGFMAHKLAQYAKTQDLAKVFSALADNPILNMAGIAANIFFFAQNVSNVAEGQRSPADYYWLTRSSMQMLTLVFDGLNPVMLPMVSVDALVILITQGEYATHVVRSVANKLPLSTGDVWKLGASSFFGSRSWSTYYENVASLESINGRLAQSLVEVLHTVNVAVGFPVSTVINEWHNRNGKLCVEGSVEVWPMITDSGHRASLAEADFSMESSVPLKEVYIGNSETQQLCYLMAKAKCSSPVLGWLKSVPNATDPCGNMRKFLDDAVERKRLIPVTTEFGDPLLEPQLRAATVKAHKAKMISRPSGWMKEKRECSRFLAVDKSRPAFLETRAPDASVFKASNCSQLRQLFTRRYIGTDRGDEVLRPYVFRRAGPASREMVLYANAPMVKVRTRSLSVLEDISMYTKMLVAKADMPAVIMVGDEGVYRGATNAPNIFVVSERTRALTVGGVGTDTVIISATEKLRITMSGDARSMIKGRDTTLITVSVESIKASA